MGCAMKGLMEMGNVTVTMDGKDKIAVSVSVITIMCRNE